MADIETLLTYLTLISVPIGVFYHIMTLNNTRMNQKMQLETRQAQLFNSLFETFRSLEFRRLWHQVMVYDWKDYEDWYERFDEITNPEAISAFSSVMLFFEGVGVLVKKDFIDIGLVYELLAESIKITWERYEPVFLGDRRRAPRFWEDFEYLYNLIQEIDENPDQLKPSVEYFKRLSETK